MTQSVYEDYKYVMQDTAYLYVGTKYTLSELTENEELLFRFRKVVADSMIPKASPEDTLETTLYYLTKENFIYLILKQLRAKVRVSVLETRKKTWFRKEKTVYVSKMLSVDEVVALTKEEKEKVGMVIAELRISKLALLSV